MSISLLASTLISVAIFIPVALILMKIKAYENPTLRKPAVFFFGGATWSFIAILQYIILQITDLLSSDPFELARESSIESFVISQRTTRTALFWYIFIAAVIGQIILYQGSLRAYYSNNAWDYTIFGLGWGVSEFVHRFLFFDGTMNVQIFLFLYCILLSSAIGATLIRIRENTKFIMFAALLKFFAEIGIFGEFGYNGLTVSFVELYTILGLAVAMAGLSMLTRKFPLKDD